MSEETNTGQRSSAAGRLPMPILLSSLLLFAAILGVGWFIAQRQEATSRTAAEQALVSIAGLKADAIENWIAERHSDAEIIGSSDRIHRFLTTPQDSAVRESVLKFFRNCEQAYGYENMAVFDSRGDLLATTSTDNLARHTCLSNHVRQALQSSDVLTTDLHRENPAEPIHFSLLSPLRIGSRTNGLADGVLLLEVNPQQFLYPFLRAWPVPSQTAETVIARREGDELVCLNNTRHVPDSALRLRLPLTRTNAPAVLAALDEPSYTIGEDYRGKPVAAATRRIAGTSWILVAKMDREEVEAPIHHDTWRLGMVIAMSLIAVALGIGMLWRHQRLRQVQSQLDEQLVAETRLRESQEQMQQIIATAQDAIVMVDPQGRISLWNEAGERIFGYSKSEAVGHNLHQLLAPERFHEASTRGFQGFQQSGQGGVIGRVIELVGRRKGGEEFPVELTVAPLRLGGAWHAVGILRDITVRKRAEKDLQERERLLGLALDVAKMGVFEVDLATGRSYWSPEVARLWELPDDFAGDFAKFCWDHTHPDDVDEVRKFYAAFLQQDGERETEFRIVRPDGTVSWLRWRGRIIRNPATGGARVAGVNLDITARRQAEEATRRETSLNEAMIEAVPGTFFVVNDAGFCVRWNSRQRDEIVGKTDAEVGRHPAMDTIHPDDRALVQAKMLSVMTGGQENYVEARVLLRGGPEFVWMHMTGRRMMIDGRPLIVGFGIDVTERRKVEEALTRREEVFSAIFNQAGDSIVLVDGETGRFVEFNRVAHESLGYTREEFAKLTLADIQAEHTREDIRRNMLRVREEGSAVFETRHRRIDGQVLDVRVSIRRLDIQWRSFMAAVWADITEQKLAEVEARRQETRLRLAMDAADMVTWELDISSRRLVYSGNLAAMSGAEDLSPYLSLDAFIQQLHPEDQERTTQAINRTIESNVPFDCEYRIHLTDGSWHWLAGRGRLATGADGRLSQVLGISQDITKRKMTEEALQQSESLFRLLAENTEDIVSLHDLAENRTFISPSYYRVTGWTLDEVTHSAWDARLHPDDLAAIKESRAANFVGKTTLIEHRIRRRDGSWIWVESRCQPIADASGKVTQLLISARDVTKRKMTEEALQQANATLEQRVAERTAALHASEERLELAFRAAQDGIWDWNMETNEVFYSSRYKTMLGYEEAEIEHHVSAWKRLLHPDDLEHAAEVVAGVLRGELEYLMEFRMRHKDGHYVHVLSRGFPITREPGGPIIRIVGTHSDLTERKRAEEELRAAKVAAESANRAKSVFLANMSHEIRTPMNAILGFSQLLLREPALLPAHRQQITTIKRSGEHLLEIINGILDMARIESGRVTLNEDNLDLHRLLDDLKQMFDERARAKGIFFEIERHGELPKYIVADETKLRQVIINLIGNAIKFTSIGGVILSLRTEPEQEGTLRLHGDVADTGKGIPPEDLPHLFQAFFQTSTGKDTSGGTGLGLAISRELTRLMGGDITVTSTVGAGSTFHFNVRVGAGAAKATQPEAGFSKKILRIIPGHPPCRVLIVDDQRENRELLYHMLQPLGFETRMVPDGGQALIRCRDWSPHLVLLDLRMPGMDGYEVARRIRNEHGQRIKILVISASVFAENRQMSLESGADLFISKPFEEAQLLDMIKQLTGVEYLHSEPGAEQAKATTEVQAAEDLKHLPKELLDEMREALRRADYNQMLALADQIRIIDAATGDRFHAWVKSFDYQTLRRSLDMPQV